MTIPLATTTITVLSPPTVDGDDVVDPYDGPPTRTAAASGVRAHISSPFGREQVAGGSQEITDFHLTCDPVTLTYLDQVLDDKTGATYDVVWTMSRQGLGLDHVTAGLRLVQGVV